MQPNLLDINKLVINLPERKERLSKFCHESAYLFKGETIRVIEGVRKEPVHKGIAEAHLNCIRLAKENNWDSVLIMEDDCVYPAKERVEDYVNQILSTLPEDWDIVLGGAYWLRSKVEVNSHWFRISEFAGLHWYIVNKNCYDKILTYNETNHIDRYIGTLGLKIYVPKRFFAIQEDGWSDNVQKETDYNKTLLTKFKVYG